MEWNDNAKFQQKKKDRSKQDPSEIKSVLSIENYHVNIHENETIVIVLRDNDVVRIVQDTEGNIYPEQFRELVNKGILNKKSE